VPASISWQTKKIRGLWLRQNDDAVWAIRSGPGDVATAGERVMRRLDSGSRLLLTRTRGPSCRERLSWMR